MLLVFAPSGRRVIPYPPVSIAVLAAALEAAGLAEVWPVDLEMRLAAAHLSGDVPLIYQRRVLVEDVLAPSLSDETASYADLLWSSLGGPDGGDVGISVMGYDQVASALLLGRTALEHGCRLLMGGQFFTIDSARQVIDSLRPWGSVTITIGDGWEAVVEFARKSPSAFIPNSTTTDRVGTVQGPQVVSKSAPPLPTYSWVPWDDYELYGMRIYQSSRPERRAHLYVWDKQCIFRCAFCRGATGSRAQLTPPRTAAKALLGLQQNGVSQVNVMTNELNPSRTYLHRFLDAMESTVTNPVTWFTYIRADYVSAEDFSRIHAAGGRLARFGVESGSQRMLDRMRKDYRVPVIEQTLRDAAGANLLNHVNFLVGFPGEQREDVEATLRFIDRNATHIHSARVNPFYLPPGTPMTREPGAFDIKLEAFESGWWTYRDINGSKPDVDVVVNNIERVTQSCVDNGIGFVGTDPFFLLDALSQHNNRDETLAHLKAKYPPLWEPAPTDIYKALIGGYKVSSEWRDTTLRRQNNYALTLSPSASSTFCSD